MIRQQITIVGKNTRNQAWAKFADTAVRAGSVKCVNYKAMANSEVTSRQGSKPEPVRQPDKQI